MSYQVSVITPVCNANLALLQKAFDSIRAQTIGFENIEWVVVNHNSLPENSAAVGEMLKDYPNVSVYSVRNEFLGPASPRNYGLDKAQGEFIAFLDADDYLENETLQKTIEASRRNGAELVTFRFEPVSENMRRLAVRPLILIDQTREEVVFDRDSWDSSQFMHGTNLSICTKLYKRDFLERYYLRFNPEVPIAEDTLFNIDCLNLCRKFCFLPQLIGYHYYLNGKSMVQSFNKSAEAVMKMVRGFTIVFNRGLSRGLYMNNLLWDLMGYTGAVLLASPKLTLAERRAVRDMFEKYFSKMSNIKLSKLYDKKTANLIKAMVNLVIKHPRFISALQVVIRALKIDVSKRIRI